MIAAAISVSDVDPGIAALVLERALTHIGKALSAYGPDGVYPEGAGYWSYGTQYTLLTISMLENSFGLDCGTNKLSNNQSLSGKWPPMFNRGRTTVALTWFAQRTSNPYFFDETYFTDSSENRRRDAYNAAALIWLTQYKPNSMNQPTIAWVGKGLNPLAVSRSDI